jgi:hypothetical protein
MLLDQPSRASNRTFADDKEIALFVARVLFPEVYHSGKVQVCILISCKCDRRSVGGAASCIVISLPAGTQNSRRFRSPFALKCTFDKSSKLARPRRVVPVKRNADVAL